MNKQDKIEQVRKWQEILLYADPILSAKIARKMAKEMWEIYDD